jgi:hypothetical protein
MKTVTRFAVVRHDSPDLHVSKAGALGQIMSDGLEGRATMVPVEVPESPEKVESFIYIVQAGDDGPIKVGWTTDVKARLSWLSTDCWMPIRLLVAFPGSRRLEHKLHTQLKDYRVAGEWFRPVKELLDFANDLKSEQLVAHLEASLGTCATGKTT